ncbi:hypothetical protein M438DRAFT_40485 [Aureobasidium pullulans EXF-150]|uniref:Uncharacterized protein n=1 Tax=Aureobasidium pullulans EXF-150 TaxID=1043002 RepID=A0A074Y856_AURPU|nr:uncharacterized protein M438DRAFT_40485 [Aureobasidium pullulans EXF-150]KEQ83046.1 hypothetical protein M438DRAFT_40485 [Aureobasidium pullulans EXF-150]
MMRLHKRMASDRSGQIVLSKLNYLHDSWTGQESSGWTATTIQDVWGGLRPTHGRWHLAHDDFYGAACTMLTSPTADVSGNSAVKFTRRLWILKGPVRNQIRSFPAGKYLASQGFHAFSWPELLEHLIVLEDSDMRSIRKGHAPDIASPGSCGS